MAHMIETMAYAGETPWHGLGKEVPADLSPEQMLVTAGLDWEVSKVPAFIRVDGEELMTGKSALVRSSDNSILDVVSNDWLPVQNHTAFEFFDDFVRAGDMEMHTAGSLKNGQIVWALAKIKDGFELFGGDNVEGYLMFTNPHKFGQSIDVRFTPIRVVCNNTLTLALSQKGDRVVKCTHKSVFDSEQVKMTLGIAGEQLRKYKEMAQFLGKKKAKTVDVKDYFKQLFPVLTQKEESRKEMSKTAEVALNILETQPGANFAKGSWWQPFNAVTYLVDHKLGRTQEGRLASAWFGPNRSLKMRALERAVEFAEVA
jgi:phage/plasmid-like protein (TIGR03299 family)